MSEHPNPLSGLLTGIGGLARGAKAAAEAAMNEKPLRIAVTGLSRAGKTVFLTSVVNNLLALGRRRNTLPRLQACLEARGANRLHTVGIAPSGASTTPYFDYAAKLAELAAETPSWPPRTEDIAEIALNFEIERTGFIGQKVGPRRLRLELLDYPGEWLLDLPLLTRSFAEWSRETVALLRRPPRAEAAAPFLEFLGTIDPHAPADDAVIRRGHALYVAALRQCRHQHGLRYLQPGRFLCPGPRSDGPFMWFFPLDGAPEKPGQRSAAVLLRERFEAYKADMRSQFFDTHFIAFDRQIVLVDVLSALHAGREAFEDTRLAIADITRALSYGSNLVSRHLQELSSAALRAVGGPLLPRHAGPSGESSPRLPARHIERVAFVATKADHVPALQRENLRNLLRALAESAQPREGMGGRPISFHAAASVLSTSDGVVKVEGRPVEVVLGLKLGEEQQRPFYPGEVPSGWPPESFWSDRFFELPTFTPPRIDPSGAAGIAHLGVDEVLTTLLKDLL